jgi:hypothetical protein
VLEFNAAWVQRYYVYTTTEENGYVA